MPAEPLRILFVCTANICRSAYAELVARSLAGDRDDVEFASAGIHGWRDHPLDAEMAAVLPAGVSAEGFASRPLTGAMVDSADLILTMEAAQRTHLLDDRPSAVRKVLTLGQAAHALARLRKESLPDRADLLRRLGTARGTADPTLDIADPYRRGHAAAARAADEISRLLTIVLEALAPR